METPVANQQMWLADLEVAMWHAMAVVPVVQATLVPCTAHSETWRSCENEDCTSIQPVSQRRTFALDHCVNRDSNWSHLQWHWDAFDRRNLRAMSVSVPNHAPDAIEYYSLSTPTVDAIVVVVDQGVVVVDVGVVVDPELPVAEIPQMQRMLQLCQVACNAYRND